MPDFLPDAGSYDGMLAEDDLERFLPGARVGTFTSVFLLPDAVPVRLEISPQGLRLRVTGRLLKRYARLAWFAPWTEVVSAESRSVGFKALGGKLSLVRQTDVVVTVVGESAQPFLTSWDLVGDPEEPAATAEDLVEDADWLKFVQHELGPTWRPGTALLRIRTSAPDGLTEAVARWARGVLPD